MGKDLPAVTETLRELEFSLLAELRDIGRAGEPGFLEERESEQDDDDRHAVPAADVESQPPKSKTKGNKQRGRR